MLPQKALRGSVFPPTLAGLVCHTVLKSTSGLAVGLKDEGQAGEEIQDTRLPGVL